MKYRGEVVRRRIGRRTKSERVAVMLVTEEGDYVLRQRGGHAFEDPVLEALVGRTLEFEGELSDYTLLVTTWRAPP